MTCDFFLHDDPNLYHAWAPWFSHEYITYYSVAGLHRLMSLAPVEVRANPEPADPVWPSGPDHVDLFREEYSDTRSLDPLWSFSYHERNGSFATIPPAGKRVEPWKVLVLYSTEPDLDLDCGLELHRLQKFTGGSHGWRHMRFRVFPLQLGIADTSFFYIYKKARALFAAGEPYWGWRHLSHCTHYLADLGNPFHVKAAPGGVVAKHLFSFKKLLKVVSAVHQGFEVYAERRFRTGLPEFRESLVKGAREGFESGGRVDTELAQYIRRAERMLTPMFDFIRDQFGGELLGAFDRLDSNPDVDTAIVTNMCSADAARIIFRDRHEDSLKYLDRTTADILYYVGKMLGMMYSECMTFFPRS